MKEGDSNAFHHALRIETEVCIGCSNCMRVCPTEALRVRNGKATLYPERCIDCGECFRVCPVNAIIIEQDDFSRIFDFKYRVALVPAALVGQFPDNISPDEVYGALVELGFTNVFEVESSAMLLAEAINQYVKSNENPKPVISSFCPAVVRLIQVKFPALVDNIMLLKPPLDLSAIYYKKMLTDKGIPDSEIGIFYITPCAAKIAAIKSPVGEDYSEVNGVINMDVIYNKALKVLKQKEVKPIPGGASESLDFRSVLWALTNGEANNINGRSLAIDSLHNVIEFLEKLENEEITDVDFIEIRVCDESCAGGVLASGNRFLAVERLKKRSDVMREKHALDTKYQINSINNYKDFIFRNLSVYPIKPRSILKLDENMARAMKKMERVHRIMCFLPGIDCGACGAPSCQALAEDIVQGQAAMSHCIFLQKTMEQSRKLHPDHSFRIMEKIWGKDRFDKNCNKVKGTRLKGQG
ncbi:MAG TPA: [Fe-Fe] hydrogenase large subunit C-terminal domain-containing protein [Tenuifilaceae bacterium]|nr:[Fe-Fe] hydrogenase large subunit C-terminal domain-containing protein [Tenuifilaceae bacterium]HPE18517.1 [Fe-Fe] hydrogenase large subunit C-terminal domain-containing protein [Tenuifilaceae bacterium]HPJ46822.1 [Fe-Fe] hydrogenase large subunit C-terminal domain-containing protein [Tenuifilaceae bacterium]HPQ35381.1 [Fe-Fe] hydrogenase large subunit C-terminal domain-containing protein [Tenuifilaceae bacterium]HRX69195.1 [Fe-Fe] hydrogenase large subunit C-terminal domain-containing prote